MGVKVNKLTIRELPRLRQSAEFAPMCFSCGRRNTGGNLVLAHSNDIALGKGVGIKTPDYFGAIVCADANGCHDTIDGRSGNLTKEGKREMHRRAHERTLCWWIESGLLIVGKYNVNDEPYWSHLPF